MSVGMSIASFLCALLVLIPLPGHWKARNVPTLSIIVWLFLVNITHGINTIAWANNVDIKLVVWCDIVIRLDIASNLALPAACFCLCMHLERVASVRHVRTSVSDKRRRMCIDLLLCLGLPLIYIALFYIVQGHRFDIVETFGCQAEDYVSIPEFFLVWFPPIVFALCTLVLAGLAFMHFFRRRATFARHLANTTSTSLTPGRYFRLMSMALVQMFWSLLITALNLSFNYAHGLRPWTNWDDVHSNWGNINRFPLLFIPPNSLRWTYFLWWTTPISTILFVAFFAFGQETLCDYKSACVWVKAKLFRRNSEKGLSSLDSSLPSFVSPKSPHSLVVDVTDTKYSNTLHITSSPPPPAYSTQFSSTHTTTSEKYAHLSSCNGSSTHLTVPITPETPALPLSSTLSRSFTESVLSYYQHELQRGRDMRDNQYPVVPEDVDPKDQDPSRFDTIYRAAFSSRPSSMQTFTIVAASISSQSPASSRPPSFSPPESRSFEGASQLAAHSVVEIPIPTPPHAYQPIARDPEGRTSPTIRYALVPDA